MMRYFLLWNILLLSCTAIAQQPDTNFVQQHHTEKLWGLHTTLQHFELSFSDQAGTTTSFQNANWALGFRLKYKKLSASVSVPILSLNRPNENSAPVWGLNFSLYPATFFITGQLRVISQLPRWRNLDNFHKQLDGGYAQVFGAYLFNQQRYSLRAALNLIDQQRKSAGSWLVATTGEYQFFELDSLAVSLEPQAEQQLNRYRNLNIGLGGGYTYTLVQGQWAITLLAAPTLEWRQQWYQPITTESAILQHHLGVRLQLFTSLLRHHNRFFYGVQAHYFPQLHTASALNSRLINWSVRSTIGWRV